MQDDRIYPEPDVRPIQEEPFTELFQKQHNLADKMIDSDPISPEPDVKEDISRLIKEEPLTEGICIKDDPGNIEAIKIEQDITAMIVRKVERRMSECELYEGFRRVQATAMPRNRRRISTPAAECRDNIVALAAIRISVCE
ncbi:uncharacterized protein [Anabrus simplex]|uniref:uncharacterized protein n=1 Tax=Anabrus simplex TaxID=316456 RepID=UPI0035A3BBFD